MRNRDSTEKEPGLIRGVDATEPENHCRSAPRKNNRSYDKGRSKTPKDNSGRSKRMPWLTVSRVTLSQKEREELQALNEKLRSAKKYRLCGMALSKFRVLFG